MARPGYKTREGHKSNGSNNKKRDHYTNKNIDMIAEAIKNLKNHYNPKKVILVGHSGGAATTGIIIGRHPGLIDSAILISCPCNVKKWRSSPKKTEGGKGAWNKSSSPHKWVDKIDKGTKVGIIIGELDKNTFPELSENYFELLKKNNISSELITIKAGHSFKFIYNNKEAVDLGKRLMN